MRSLLAALLLGTVFSTAARADEPRVDAGSIWTFRVENDKVSTIPRGSDQNYTSGVQIGWTSGPEAVPDFAVRFAHLLWGEGTVRVGFGLSQQFYTPGNTTLSTPNPRDRPYAGYLAGTFSLMQDSQTTRDLLALSLGVVGPSALGQQTQNGFHALINVPLAEGWSHQLPDEAAAELLAQRTWRIGIGRVGGIEADLLPSVAVGVGTVRDYVQTAVLFRIGQGLDVDFGPSRILPGISGGDAFSSVATPAWYFFGGIDGQAIARDAFLDGDLFSRSAHVTRNPLLGELEAGLALVWQGVRLSYTQTWQTEQFRHQKAGLFNFGSLAVSVRF